MIASPSWFTRRKYTGWGLIPRTWQGVLYIIAIGGVIAFIQALPVTDAYRMIFTVLWILIVFVDVLRLMTSLTLDEREQKIEAIAERNASWTMVAASALTILYVSTVGKELKGTELVPALIFPIAAGAIAKAVTNFILDRRGI